MVPRMEVYYEHSLLFNITCMHKMKYLDQLKKSGKDKRSLHSNFKALDIHVTISKRQLDQRFGSEQRPPPINNGHFCSSPRLAVVDRFDFIYYTRLI